MNCKPGDLAVMVRSAASNHGLIVSCLKIATDKEMIDCGFDFRNTPAWVVDRKIISNHGTLINIVPDSFLRPIRDNPGDDETLTWAGKPEHVAA